LKTTWVFTRPIVTTAAVEVGYLYGGTAALVMGVNAFTS
jgi:hypothetical protein